MTWPFGSLKMFGYDLSMIDPPWPTQMRSARGEKKSSVGIYGYMEWGEIEALPVNQLFSGDHLCWLWCTWPLLLDGGDPKRHFKGADASRSRVGACLQKWGLRYVTGGAWFKRTITGKASFGTGYRLRSACEPYLIAVSGRPISSRSERNIVDGLAREHSRKPEEAYQACERLMPGARRVELFSRTSRRGWDTWGLQAGKFDPVVSLQSPANDDRAVA